MKLLKYGASIGDREPVSGETALHGAAAQGRVQAVQVSLGQ